MTIQRVCASFPTLPLWATALLFVSTFVVVTLLLVVGEEEAV